MIRRSGNECWWDKTIVVAPWRSRGDRHREAAWGMARDGWKGWALFTADDGGEPFSRAASINQAVAEHPADVYVIVDADILIDHAQVEAAIDLAAHAPGLVVAFDRWAHLTEEGTGHVLDGYMGSWEPFVDVTFPSISACIVVNHETWELTGGFDARFRAWGGEDVAFALACETLAGPIRKVPGTAWHLYHPPDSNRPEANFDLMRQYEAACGNPDAMRAVMASA